MGELYADSKYGPGQIPSDAVLVLRWEENYPPHWQVVAIGSGFATLADVPQALKDVVPDIDGANILVTQVGGNRSRVKRMSVDTQISRTLTEVDPG